ncbi:microtubule-associated protein futsch [Drosophila navojoa]|uniref:microtubule-associated protein futsch n=1 Tax=Drosophila navojoa TaxID=7232 RepID=UPI0011BEC7B9|nr:microtubule-associated protein futsch [Drosophila navojoa]
MLSKMAQPNTVGGGGGSGSNAATGRRMPMSLTGSGASGTTVSRLQQQAAASNGRSKSPQNTNANKKPESNVVSGPIVAIKKTSGIPQRSSSSSSVASSQNGSSKSTNGNQKSSQNGSSSGTTVKEQQKIKEKVSDKKDPAPADPKDETNEIKSNAKPIAAARVADPKFVEAVTDAMIDFETDCVITEVFSTPTSDRKSSRRLAGSSSSLDKSPIKPKESPSPVSKKQAEKPKDKSNVAEKTKEPLEAAEKTKKPLEVAEKTKEPSEVAEKTNEPSEVEETAKKQSEETEKAKENLEVVEDVEMETLTVDASPIRAVANVQPTATSTPGRNLFGFRSSSKQSTEVELAIKSSSSSAITPARSYTQISGRRSIRPTASITPGKLDTYRCVNTDLDTSNCTNTSMNATVGSEIPNSSSFSFSFFGRGRKRERTPPPLSGSQSATDIAQDVDMSPPKRARFDLFSLNLASPFTMLRSRFSKTTISTPSSRQRHEQTPPAGDEEGSEVQNVSGIISQEEEEEQLNKSAASTEVSVAQEAGSETPKKSGSIEEGEEDITKDDQKVEDQGEYAVATLPATDVSVPIEREVSNTSRCAIM